MWDARDDFRSKKTELVLARKDPKARGHKDNRTKFELIIKETEDHLKKIYRDIEIEELPSRLNNAHFNLEYN